MFFCGRLALFSGLGLLVITLFVTPNAQAQFLEISQLEDSEESFEHSEDAALGGIAPDFTLLDNYPLLQDDKSSDPNPFEPLDSAAFNAEDNAFLSTLPIIRSVADTNALDESALEIAASSQSACLHFSSPSSVANGGATATVGILPAIANPSRLAALSSDCTTDSKTNFKEVSDFLKSVVSVIKITDFQQEIVCLLRNSEHACERSRIALLKAGKSSEKVPEPTVSAAVWLGVAAAGVLSAKFKPKSQR